MWKYRKYKVEVNGRTFDGKVAQHVGKFSYQNIRRIKLMDKLGVKVHKEVS